MLKENKTSADGYATIYHGSYLDLSSLDEVKAGVPLIVADPPYNIGINDKDWDKDFHFDEMFDWINSTLSDDGSAIVFNTLQNVLNFQRWVDLGNYPGLKVIDQMRWLKTNPYFGYFRDKGYIRYDSEYMLWVSRAEEPIFNTLLGEHYTSSVYNYPIANSQGSKHPTQKPIKLIEEIVYHHSNLSDNRVILDPFAGSGAVSKGIANMHRRAIGTELDDKNFNLLKL